MFFLELHWLSCYLISVPSYFPSDSSGVSVCDQQNVRCPRHLHRHVMLWSLRGVFFMHSHGYSFLAWFLDQVE